MITVPIMFIVTDVIALSIIFYVANFTTIIIIVSLLFVPKAFFVLQSMLVKLGTSLSGLRKKKLNKKPSSKEIELQEPNF